MPFEYTKVAQSETQPLGIYSQLWKRNPNSPFRTLHLDGQFDTESPPAGQTERVFNLLVQILLIA